MYDARFSLMALYSESCRKNPPDSWNNARPRMSLKRANGIVLADATVKFGKDSFGTLRARASLEHPSD
jgi:hypothetical protein